MSWDYSKNHINKFLIMSSAVASLMMSSLSYAMSVEPMHLEMKSVGKAASSSLLVTNEGAAPLPVEIMMERMTMDASGGSDVKENNTEWLVFPPQTIIAPGGKQVFRIQWLGDPALAQSQSYYAVMKQVPVERGVGESGIQVVYNFKSLINVSPPGDLAPPLVESVRLASDKKGITRLALMVSNPSHIHALLSKADVRVAAISVASGNEVWSRKLSASHLRGTVGIGLVQPGLSREFILPIDLPEKVTTGGVSFTATVVPNS